MDTEYLVVDDHTQSEKVEHVCKIVPDIGVAVLAGTLGIKAVRLRHTAGFVVASNQMHSVGVS